MQDSSLLELSRLLKRMDFESKDQETIKEQISTISALIMFTRSSDWPDDIDGDIAKELFEDILYFKSALQLAPYPKIK